MLRIIGLVIAIALGDSLNPSTIGPALYVASGDRARSGVLEFTLAVFLVHFAGGALLLLGPGQLVLSLLNGIGHTTGDVLEIAAGVTMVTAAAALWHQRGRLADKDLPNPSPQRKSSLLLGATIIAVELPTAFPYFAAITAILGSDNDVPSQMLLLALYNLCFTLPLITILTTLLLAGHQAQNILTHGRQAIERRWPIVFAALLLLAGLILALIGSIGLAGS
jgi:cytochrome c biogenesis protein CcdA